MMYNFKNTFGFELSKQHAAMPPDYKPEIDTTDLYTDADKVQHWQYIYEIQWDVTLVQIVTMYYIVVISQ